MTMRSAICASLAFSLWASGSQAAGVTKTYLTFTASNDIQTGLIKEFPVGVFTAANTFKTRFRIRTANPNSHPLRYNFYDGNFYGAPRGQALSIGTSIYGVTHVFTLMNAYSPSPGDVIATVAFTGSGGASKTFNLVAGTDIRDFYQGIWANTINGTTTRNAFEVQNVQDAASTGNVNTGLTGTYVIDEQNFALPAAFKTQTLTQIVVTPTGAGVSQPIVLGVTVRSVAGDSVALGLRQ